MNFCAGPHRLSTMLGLQCVGTREELLQVLLLVCFEFTQFLMPLTCVFKSPIENLPSFLASKRTCTLRITLFISVVQNMFETLLDL